jgi:hypothetical protein
MTSISLNLYRVSWIYTHSDLKKGKEGPPSKTSLNSTALLYELVVADLEVTF